MKSYTVKRGRYRTKRTEIEERDLSTDRAALEALVQAFGAERAKAYEEAVARGDLGAYGGEVGGSLTLEQIIADARRLVLPILTNGPGRRTIDAPHGGTLKDDPLMHAATMVNYHALRIGAANIEPDELRELMVSAVMLGYRWCELVTNRDNLEQTGEGRCAQQVELGARQKALRAWLVDRGLRARDLRYSSRNRTEAMQAWAGKRVRGLSDSTFNRDLDALEASGH